MGRVLKGYGLLLSSPEQVRGTGSLRYCSRNEGFRHFCIMDSLGRGIWGEGSNPGMLP